MLSMLRRLFVAHSAHRNHTWRPTLERLEERTVLSTAPVVPLSSVSSSPLIESETVLPTVATETGLQINSPSALDPATLIALARTAPTAPVPVDPFEALPPPNEPIQVTNVFEVPPVPEAPAFIRLTPGPVSVRTPLQRRSAEAVPLGPGQSG